MLALCWKQSFNTVKGHVRRSSYLRYHHSKSTKSACSPYTVRPIRARAGGGAAPCNFSANWNCVYYNVHTYQQSILSEMPALIAAAHAQINPRANIDIAPAISEKMESAMKVCVS